LSKNNTESNAKQTYSKSAFLNAAKGSKERLILTVLLEDDKSYTKAEVEKAVSEWKSKEVKA
jgi:hypothetical protein